MLEFFTRAAQPSLWSTVSASGGRQALLWAAILLASLVGPATAKAQNRTNSVAAAIDRGIRALIPELERTLEVEHQTYPMGYIALPLAALLKSGLLPDHPLALRAFARLEELPPRKTYSVACYLFALDARWQARVRRSRDRPHGRGRTVVGSGVLPRIPPPGPEKTRMEELIAWLVRGRGGMWNYGGRASGDLSNSQFAVLGLEIGLQNGVSIPVEVFESVAKRFLSGFSPTGPRERFRITRVTAAWQGVTRGRQETSAHEAVPGGWDYRADRKEPTGNMTAAGVSSLLIARHGLRRFGAYSGKLAREVDAGILSGLAWMTKRVRNYWGDYYGMYSLEKVGDIGRIMLLGNINWYTEGASFLLKKQKQDGSWGSMTNTSFALLFLTRATRSPLETLGPPVQLTRGAGGNESDDAESDLIFIPQLEGFLSAAALFNFLADTRDPAVIPLARSAVEGFPPHRAPELLDHLLSLGSERRDATTRFALEAAARLTGLKRTTFEEQEKTLEQLQALKLLGRQKKADSNEVRSILESARSPLVQTWAIDLVHRQGLLDVFGAVIDLLGQGDRTVQERARRVLVEWAGKQVGVPGSGEEIDAWRSWLKRHARTLRLDREVEQLVAGMRQGRDVESRDRLARQLVAIGDHAVPFLLRAMDEDEYPIQIVEVLEAVTGEAWGLDPALWRQKLRMNR